MYVPSKVLTAHIGTKSHLHLGRITINPLAGNTPMHPNAPALPFYSVKYLVNV